MKLPRLPQWVAPVLVVVFALTTVWAAYNVDHVASASPPPSGSGPALSYEGSSSYDYVAALLPNDLFNSTHVSGPNVTLFVAITQWVNVTFVTSLELGAPTAAAIADAFTVSVTTAVWSKTLYQTSQRNQSDSTEGLSLVDRYDLNVSGIERTVRTIDAQLNYSASSFTVSLSPAVVGTVAWGASAGPVVLQPFLNLTFSGSLIVPKGGTATDQAEVPGALLPADPSSPGALDWAVVELAASVLALGAAGWLLWMERRHAGAPSLPALDKLIEPYQEVIARTTLAPEGMKVLPVEAWEDLVKVADTLGRPILRPVASSSDPWESEFYVFDGTAAYVYRYPRREAPPAEPEAAEKGGVGTPAAGGPIPAAARAARSSSLADARRLWAGRRRSLNRELTEQLQAQLRRLREAPLDPAKRWYAFSLVTQAVRTVSAADPETAQRAVDELRLALDLVLREGSPGR